LLLIISLEVIVNLIAATTTSTGLTFQCVIDNNIYEKGLEVSDKELVNVNIIRDEYLRDWNYTIVPELLRSFLVKRLPSPPN
jgi:hypothetical protein